MDQNFYNLLYNGYTGEFQLMGALYRNGLDALRPPADMGVDVVTVNLKAQLQDPSVQPETLMFQVKTAVVTVQKAGEGMRGYTTVYFMLKESEVDMLCAARTRALVCYVYDNRNSMLTDAYEAPFISFWIDGEHLRKLRESGAFTQADNGKLAITCQLREPADETGHWYASVIDQMGRTVDNGYLGSLEADGNRKDSFDGADHYSIRGYLEHVRKQSSDATCDNRALAKDVSEKKLETASEKAAGTKPVAAKSVDVKSDAAQSSVAQPAGSESGAAQSASAQIVGEKSATAQLSDGKPAGAQSVGSKHDAGRPVGTKPFVVQIVGVGSDVARPNAAQPVSVQPSIEESAPAKLACERPDAARPTDAGQTDEGAAEVELPW